MEYIPLKSKQKEKNLQTVFALVKQLVLYFTGGNLMVYLYRLVIDFFTCRFLYLVHNNSRAEMLSAGNYLKIFSTTNRL